MNRVWMLTAALFGISSAANAATLAIDPGGVGGVYNVGELITITVTGDSQGASDVFIYGRISFSNPAVAAPNIDPASSVQNPLVTPGAVDWSLGGTICTSNACDMFSQVSPSYPAASFAGNLLTASVSFVATTPGSTNLSWITTGGSALDFFGLTSAPGSSLTVVPEPSTAGLLGLGLLALALRSRRQS